MTRSLASSRRFLLTGATGNLGFAVLRAILAGSSHGVTALVRDGREPEIVASLERLGILATGERLRFIRGDIRLPSCGVDPLAEALRGVTDVIHTAADVRWHAEPALLRATNVRGTQNLLDLAEALAAHTPLHRITVVSSVYLSGRRDDDVPEAPLDRPSFNNPYEESKFEMERAALARTSLPINVLRPSTLVGDSRDGTIRNFTTAYFPFRLILANRLPFLPGFPGAILDLIPCDHAAALALAMHERSAGPGEIVHACAGPDAQTLGEIWRLSCETFDSLRPLRRPRRHGLFVPPWLVAAARGLPSSLRRSLDRLALYAPYLSMRRSFERRKAVALGLPPPPHPKTYFEELCRYAIERDFRSARSS